MSDLKKKIVFKNLYFIVFGKQVLKNKELFFRYFLLQKNEFKKSNETSY